MFSRRKLLHLAGATLGGTLAGCQSRSESAPAATLTEPATTTTSPSPRTTTSTTTCSVPTTETVTTYANVTTTESSESSGVTQGLAIRTKYSEPLTVVLTHRGTTTFAKEYPASTEAIGLFTEMLEYSRYTVVIRSGCELLWTQTINHYEQIEITIEPNGSVTRTGGIME